MRITVDIDEAILNELVSMTGESKKSPAVSRVVTDWVGIDALKSYGVRFSKQVFPGATLTTTVTVKSIEGDTAEFDVSTKDDNGDVVVVGYATARLEG